jgi:hypothetical protein
MALALYGWQLARLMGAHAGASDSSGYMNHARLLATGSVTTPIRTVEGAPPRAEAAYTYVPLGFRPVALEPPTMVPTYPSGLPVLLLLGSSLLGWSYGPGVVMGLHAIAGLLLVYAFARRWGLSPLGAAIAAAMVGASPLYFFMAQQAMTDVPALVWTTAALLLAERSRDRSPKTALWVGLALGVAALIRPTNVLLLAPLLLSFGLSIRRWGWFGLGVMPAAVFYFAHSHAAYGAFLTTGYGDVSQAFKRALLLPTVLHYGRWLPILLTPLVLLALALPFVLRSAGERRRAALLAVWALAFLGFYSVYDHTHETWWYLRFVLPAFPPLAIAAVWTGERLLNRWEWRARVHLGVAASVITGVILFASSWGHRLHAAYGGRHEQVYPVACAWAQTQLPPGAVVVAMQMTGALQYHTDFTLVRWDHVQPEDVVRIEQHLAETDQPLFALLFEFETADAFRRWGSADWEPVGQSGPVTAWRRRGPEGR